MLKVDVEDISVDCRTGEFSNANLFESQLIRLMKLANYFLRPFGWTGVSRIWKLIGMGFDENRWVMFKLSEDALFRVPASDYYWSRLYAAGQEYEPEIRKVLTAARDLDYVFLDCGANFGFWSILVSSNAFGSHPAIAIEFSPVTFQVLEKNCAINGDRFHVHKEAILDRSDLMVPVFGKRHAGRSVVDAQKDGHLSDHSTSIALDDLIFKHYPHWAASPLIIKLDVEGVEDLALLGANQLLTNDVLVIFEDLGDMELKELSEVSHSFLACSLMRLFAYTVNGFCEIHNVDELMAVKQRWLTLQSIGYNFFATKSPKWAQIMETLTCNTSKSN